ncbi:response regulator [Mucilaginibacter sp. HD30]
MSKLIMIDDNPMEHYIMQKMFDKHNLFQDAAHAAEAQVIIDFLKENRYNTAELPDLIFLDLNMPICDGFSFLEQFQRLCLSFQKPISIYVVSSSVDENDHRRVAAYPFVKEFLIKPVTKDKLELIYTSYFKNSRKAS